MRFDENFQYGGNLVDKFEAKFVIKFAEEFLGAAKIDLMEAK